MSVLDRFRLDGRRLFITGGSRGLGREMALAIADAGADVALTGRDLASLERTAEDIRRLGRQAWTFQSDLADPSSCETVCARALAQHGPFDILINNIGGRRDPAPLEEMPRAQWQALIDLNLTSTFICTQAIGGQMVRRGQGGRIINIASINAFVAGRGIGGRHYETAKAAVVQLTRAAAADWAPHGVTVNAICPGLFMTEPNQRWARERPDMIAGIKERTPMQTFGAPEDLGPLAVYLASDAAQFMTGAALVIDGGYTLW